MTTRRHTFDISFLAIVGLLTGFGLIALTSASSVEAFAKYKDSFYLIKHQILLGFLPGILLFFICLKIRYTFWKTMATPILIIALALLVLVLVPGIGTKLGGARSWFNVGGISFQPSEVAKLALIIYLSAWMSKHGEEIKDVKYGLVPFLVVTGLMLGLIMLQPDIGTMMITAIIAVIIFFLGGGSIKHIALMGVAGILGLFALIKAAPYRAARLLTFLHPELDPKGIGYQINQALLAIGSGGIFGLGFGHSRQKFRYLPEVTGDSIFAIIGEELGFILAAGLIVLFLWYLLRAISIAKHSNDEFGRFLALGIGVWVTVQAFINVAAMIGLMPLTGVPLPFISYGGTSLAILLGASGILLNISKYSKE